MEIDMKTDINLFFTQFLVTALWSSTDDTESPLDANYSVGDFDPDTLKQLRAECKTFIQLNDKLLAQAGDSSQNGHDFWLTRCGHGAGYWDRGYGDVGNQLTLASERAGNRDLYIGDDDLIYV
jgi:hypothetical protein